MLSAKVTRFLYKRVVFYMVVSFLAARITKIAYNQESFFLTRAKVPQNLDSNSKLCSFLNCHSLSFMFSVNELYCRLIPHDNTAPITRPEMQETTLTLCDWGAVCVSSVWLPLYRCARRHHVRYINTSTVHLLLLCTTNNKCTINSQIITFLHVSILLRHS